MYSVVFADLLGVSISIISVGFGLYSIGLVDLLGFCRSLVSTGLTDFLGVCISCVNLLREGIIRGANKMSFAPIRMTLS